MCDFYSVKVASIHIYPIKSLGAVDLPSAQLDTLGLKVDRRWMIVDSKGVTVTQRNAPMLSQVKVWLYEDAIVFGNDTQRFEIPREHNDGPKVAVELFIENLEGHRYDGNPKAIEWLAELVGFEVQLVYLPTDLNRPVDPEYATGYTTAYTDGFPLLVISQASLHDLNARLDDPVTMQRFRPNIVLADCLPFAEDELGEFRIGSLSGFRQVKPCARCVVTTINPNTSEKGKEPLATLSKYRSQNGKVMFGQNVVGPKDGWLEIGDLVIPVR